VRQDEPSFNIHERLDLGLRKRRGVTFARTEKV
jgi:hypothetical protein